jgi:hypothetical protein
MRRLHRRLQGHSFLRFYNSPIIMASTQAAPMALAMWSREFPTAHAARVRTTRLQAMTRNLGRWDRIAMLSATHTSAGTTEAITAADGRYRCIGGTGLLSMMDETQQISSNSQELFLA